MADSLDPPLSQREGEDRLLLRTFLTDSSVKTGHCLPVSKLLPTTCSHLYFKVSLLSSFPTGFESVSLHLSGGAEGIGMVHPQELTPSSVPDAWLVENDCVSHKRMDYHGGKMLS